MVKNTELTTVPKDYRWPSQNQTRYCWGAYVDYHRCINRKGDDEGSDPCSYYKKVFTVMCPKEWVAKWDDQRENGCFAAKLD